jgi:hypothetical protein
VTIARVYLTAVVLFALLETGLVIKSKMKSSR